MATRSSAFQPLPVAEDDGEPLPLWLLDFAQDDELARGIFCRLKLKDVRAVLSAGSQRIGRALRLTEPRQRILDRSLGLLSRRFHLGLLDAENFDAMHVKCWTDEQLSMICDPFDLHLKARSITSLDLSESRITTLWGLRAVTKQEVLERGLDNCRYFNVSDGVKFQFAHLRSISVSRCAAGDYLLRDAITTYLGGFAATLEVFLASDSHWLYDKDVENIGNLTALQELSLAGCCKLTDASMCHLRKLAALRRLDLRGCEELTDSGVQQLASLTQLRELNVGGLPRISDASVAHISVLPHLEKLSLGSCALLTDACAVHLEKMQSLAHLNVSCGRLLSDAVMPSISKLAGLRSLDVSYCPLITGKGMEALVGLRDINVSGCGGMDGAARRALKEALPECRISA